MAPVKKPVVARTGRWPQVRLAVVTGAAIAACHLLLFVPGLLPGLRADHATRTAELRDVVLADGTHMSLGPRSGLDVRLGADRRQVKLLDGEVFFEVETDASWPFVADSQLAAQRVTRIFDVQDVDRALAALVQPFDGRVQGVTPLLRILAAP